MDDHWADVIYRELCALRLWPSHYEPVVPAPPAPDPSEESDEDNRPV